MEGDTKPNVQKSPSSCYCMKLLTQPTQQSESDTCSPRAAPSMGTLGFTSGEGVGLGFFGGEIISSEGRGTPFSALLPWEQQLALLVGAWGHWETCTVAGGGVAPFSIYLCALGRLTELRAHLHLTGNFARIKSRQSFLSCATDI